MEEWLDQLADVVDFDEEAYDLMDPDDLTARDLELLEALAA